MGEYYVILDKGPEGPFFAEALIGLPIARDTPVWTVGMADWVTAGQVPELLSLLNTRPPPAPSARTPAVYGLATRASQPAADYLLFDPSRPRMLGLIVAYGLVIAPLLWMTSTCVDLMTIGKSTHPADDFLELAGLAMGAIDLVFVAALFAGAMGLRMRRRFGLALAATILTLRPIVSILALIVVIAICATIHANTPPIDAADPVGTEPDLGVVIFSAVVYFAGLLFECGAAIWLFVRWRVLREGMA